MRIGVVDQYYHLQTGTLFPRLPPFFGPARASRRSEVRSLAGPKIFSRYKINILPSFLIINSLVYTKKEGNTLFRSSCCCLDASLYVLVSYGLAYLMGHNPIVYRACPTVRQTVPHGRLKDKVAKSRPLLAPRRVCFVKGFCEILFYTG